MMLIQGYAKRSGADWQGTWTWLQHSSGTNKGIGLSWNAAPEWRSCFSQLSRTTHLNTINLNQGSQRHHVSTNFWAQADNPGVGSVLKGLTTKRTRWKEIVTVMFYVLLVIYSQARKRTTQTSFRWDSKCQDWERRKWQEKRTQFL